MVKETVYRTELKVLEDFENYLAQMSDNSAICLSVIRTYISLYKAGYRENSELLVQNAKGLEDFIKMHENEIKQLNDLIKLMSLSCGEFKDRLDKLVEE